MSAFGGIPQAVSGELVRARLIQQLEERFSVAVTLVTAGPGFGKSTALAQAVRHHQLAPSGIDVWLTCAPGDEQAQRLGRRLHGALAEAPGFTLARERNSVSELTTPGQIADALVRDLVDCSPLQVCVVLDDCHLLGESSSATELLASLVRRLPANAHLVLAGRSVPALPLARLRLAEQVRQLDQDDLAFTTEECRTAASLVGRTDVSAGLGGWPALVRLSLLAAPGAGRDFLAEEVLATVDPDQRRQLLALTLLGPSTEAHVAEVLGSAIDLARLARLPLVSVDADGSYRAHLLWQRAVRDAVHPDELRSIELRVIQALIRRGDYARAGSAAIAAGDHRALDRVALSLVRNSMSNLPVETASTWLDSLGVESLSPTMQLLEALVRHTKHPADSTIGASLDGLAAEAVEQRDPELHAAVLAVAALSAHAQADFGRLFSIAAQASGLPETEHLIVLQLLRTTIEAIGADLRGDPEGALDSLQRLPWDQIGRRDSNTAARLYLQAMWMSGESAAAVEFCNRWYGQSAPRRSEVLGRLSRWFDGDSSGFPDSEQLSILMDPDLNERDRFVAACYCVVMLACVGEGELVDRLWTEHDLAGRAQPNARDSAHVTNAEAARRLANHDEPGAAVVVAAHFERYPLADALGERHMRRWPAIGFVLHAGAREHWTRAALGPSHVKARQAAEALLSARRQSIADAPADDVLLTQLPMVWSVELACRWAVLGSPRAVGLANHLADRSPSALSAELQRLQAERDPAVAAGATTLLRALPREPNLELAIDVLGPMRLRIDGVTCDAPELRRGRVRQLLAMLVVERSIRRDRAMELLWPDLGADAAGTNLRVTLTHLRRLLEPDRSPGDAGFHVRTDVTTITLHPSPQLQVDLWEAEQIERTWRSARSDTDDQVARLEELVTLWRGEPLADLADISAFAGLRERLHLRHVSTLMRLGELSLAIGNPNRAWECGAQALELEPFDEQAHRLAIAAQLQRRDVAGTHRALERLSHALGDLGVQAEPPTEVLTRSAHGWLDRATAHQPTGIVTTSR